MNHHDINGKTCIKKSLDVDGNRLLKFKFGHLPLAYQMSLLPQQRQEGLPKSCCC